MKNLDPVSNPASFAGDDLRLKFLLFLGVCQVWLPKNKEESKWLRSVRNKQIKKKNPAEMWFYNKFKADYRLTAINKNGNEVPLRLVRQRQFGGRIFDFYIKRIRVAIEIDGKNYHDREKDLLRDREYQKRFNLRIYRIWAFDEINYAEVISEILNDGYLPNQLLNKNKENAFWKGFLKGKPFRNTSQEKNITRRAGRSSGHKRSAKIRKKKLKSRWWGIPSQTRPNLDRRLKAAGINVYGVTK